MPTLPKNGVYAITDCQNCDINELLKITSSILDAGIAVLQYRDNINKKVIRFRLANKLQTLCKDKNCLFIINNDIDLVSELDADGLHIGDDDIGYDEARERIGSDRIIGVSCYNETEKAITAKKNGADYVAFGSFYPSRTKPDAVCAKRSLLQNARARINIPIVAIGGITPENAKKIISAGADFIAVSSALYSSDMPDQTAKQFIQLFNTKSD